MRKVVFVIESLGLGGAEKSLVTLLQNLDYTKYSVSLILFQKEGIFKKFVPHQVNVICLENKKVSLIDRVKFKLYKSLQPNHHPAQLFWKVLNKKIKPFAENFDVAIAYNQGFATYYTSQYINADIKYAWVNTDYKKAGYNLDFDLQFYKFYNKIISVSPEAKEVLENLLSERKMVLDIDVIKDITDKKILFLQSEEFVPVEFNKLKINILTVGRLSKHKALHLAIEACKILIDKGYDVNWFVLGEGNERGVLKSLIGKYNLEKQFFLLDSKDNPYPYIKASDIYVQTSKFEGLGLSVIEASYLCKPIVSTNFPSVFSLIKDAKTGLISNMNSNDIALKVEQLITNKVLKEQLISNLEKEENNDKESSLIKIYMLLDKSSENL